MQTLIQSFNAFATLGRVMSVNKGALDTLDDDQLAYVMAHEIAHGEHKDIINGAKKQIGPFYSSRYCSWW